MIDSGKVKVGVMAVLLLAALAAFDYYGTSFSGITGAQTAITQAACTDSDEQKNSYEVAGTASSATGSKPDYCDFSNGYTNVLQEAVCEGGKPAYVKKTCPRNAPYCNRGKCNVNPPKCYETDEGKQPWRGTVTGAWLEPGPQYTDYCMDLATGKQVDNCIGDSCGLREYSCDGALEVKWEDLKCKGFTSLTLSLLGCSGGRGDTSPGVSCVPTGASGVITSATGRTETAVKAEEAAQTSQAVAAATSADCAKGEKAVLMEGSTGTYQASGKEYKVKADIVQARATTFIVNGGTVSWEKNQPDVQSADLSLADGATLRVFRKIFDTTPYSIEFCIKGVEPKPAEASAESADCSSRAGLIMPVLKEGEKKAYEVAGKEYKAQVVAFYISDQTMGSEAKYAWFIINGESLTDVKENSYYDLADGATLKTRKIVTDKEPFGVEFCIYRVGAKCGNSQACVIGALQNGGSMDYLINGKVYNVLAEFVGTTEVKFTVNKEASSSIGAGESYTYRDGTVLTVSEIRMGQLVDFKFDAANRIEVSDTMVTLWPGWNIVAVDALLNPVLTDCTGKQLFRKAWIYNPQTPGGYDLYDLSGDLYKLSLPPDGGVDASSAAYIWNNGDISPGSSPESGKSCSITASLSAAPHGLALRDGWSFVGILPGWKGKKLSEVLSSGCELEVAWVWLMNEGKWASFGAFPIAEQEPSAFTFGEEYIGRGFWINAKGCVIG